MFFVFLLFVVLAQGGDGDEISTNNVVLLGDGLFSNAIRDFNLIGMINRNFPESKLDFRSYASGASRISDIRNQQLRPAISTMPDIIIMLWNSDCSDIDESQMSTEEVRALRQAYSVDLKYVIKTIKDAGAFLIMGGKPTNTYLCRRREILNTHKYEKFCENVNNFDISFPCMACIDYAALYFTSFIWFYRKHNLQANVNTLIFCRTGYTR